MTSRRISAIAPLLAILPAVLLAVMLATPAGAQSGRPEPAPPPPPVPLEPPPAEPNPTDDPAVSPPAEPAQANEPGVAPEAEPEADIEVVEEVTEEAAGDADEAVLEEEIAEASLEEAPAEEAALPDDDAGEEADAAAEPEPVVWSTEGIRPDRRPVKDEPVVLAFKDVQLEELIEFIALETGKIVMPIDLPNNPGGSRDGYNIVADHPMSRTEALDFIFTYLRMQDIGIIERPRVIFIGEMDNMVTQLGEIEVVSAETSVADRTDRGGLIFKIFQIRNTDAAQIKDGLQGFFPEDWAIISEDDLSNQIMVLGDVGLCQQVEQIINDIDRKWLQPVIQTFRLRYADAREIETNVLELFEQSGGTSSTNRSNQNQSNRNQRNRSSGSSGATTTSTEGIPEAELRLTVNEQQNTVTVQGEQKTVEEIATLIETQWDRPRPEGTSRLFILKYTDPIKVTDLLTAVLGGGSSGSSGSSNRRSGRQGGSGQSQRTDATAGIAGVYQFEAFPDRNALLVLAKTEESFSFIQSVIEEIDQPSDAGLPEIIPLKYADAVALTEEINILLAKAGGRVSLPRPETGLTAEGFSTSGDGLNVSGPDTSGTSSDLQFPWGNSGDSDEQAPESSLIGKVRVVPIVRQNALAILAPTAYREPMRKLIEAFDQPRRQVMLSATIVEVDLGDALNLGMRVGTGWQPDTGALVAGSVDLTMGAIDFITNMLDGSQTNTLTLGPFDINVIIEALNSITNTRVIQEPRVFTADNEEAVFFAGQEYPIATGSVEASTGLQNLTTTIEYKNVGVFLNVRPRITEEGAVDLAVSLELSQAKGAVNVGNTQSEIFDRKQVTTHAILLDGQTIVLGGLLRELEQIKRDRIPLLADIPIIGQLFEFNDEKLERTELIAFITPTVVHRPVDNYDNYNLEDLGRLESVARPLAEQIAEGEKIIDLNVHERLGRHTPSGSGGRVLLPSEEPTQNQIDAYEPELIELTPRRNTSP
ncbi:MAG: secretin N-terminal domain-containing protein [Phycisphaerales bacterium]|jgi:type II secretion system protein D|nr:secretin N-terminal domain-containing protein [Phycisphaerales bacterium]